MQYSYIYTYIFRLQDNLYFQWCNTIIRNIKYGRRKLLLFIFNHNCYILLHYYLFFITNKNNNNPALFCQIKQKKKLEVVSKSWTF